MMCSNCAADTYGVLKEKQLTEKNNFKLLTENNNEVESLFSFHRGSSPLAHLEKEMKP